MAGAPPVPRALGRDDHRPQPADRGDGLSDHPFVRFRWLLDSYREARQAGWSDAEFVSTVERLDSAVAEVEGHGLAVTPLTVQPGLATAIGLPSLWVKDETGNVGGSHKVRHLFGVLLHLVVTGREGELAIASCGSAALAAAVVARAVERPLRVFVPTWADPDVLGRLDSLAARVEVCPRRPGERGDPAYLRLVEAVAEGAVPFSAQGAVTPVTLDGGRTIGWELAEQLGMAGVEGDLRLFVQVGGGTLASSAWMGLTDGIREQWVAVRPRLHAVQTEACAPLARAWELLRREGGTVEEMVARARAEPDRYMWPWEEVGTSIASGVLDDVTYDWLTVVEPMLRSGGWPIVVSEDMVVEAHELGRRRTGIEASPTGTAGLAGLLDRTTAASVRPEEHLAVLFTGVL